MVDSVFEFELQGRTLYVDAEHVPQCVELWRTGRYTQLGISDHENPGLKNIDFIEAFFPVADLHLMLFDKVDLSVLRANAEWLKHFFTNAGPNAIDDIRPFTKLESLGQPWTRKFRVDASLDRLKGLALGGFRSASGDVTELSVMPALEKLSLYSNRLQSLKGLETMQGLRELFVSSAPKLEYIDPIGDLNELRDLRFEHCKITRGFADLVRGKHLLNLRYMKCSPLDHVRFVSRLCSLQSFVFLDTDVLDGNMAPLVDHPTLAHVAFTKKKHFTLSERQILERLGDREGGVRARMAKLNLKKAAAEAAAEAE
ncbi:hypothetical protein CKY51_17695 [Xanthomonas maliensis]|nr:hypothetical protein CKY51_17695 [Xanthomonas maliensis]